MEIAVRLFASYREAVGAPLVRLEVPEGAAASHVWERLAASYPRLRALPAPAGYAVDDEYVPGDGPLGPGQTVFLIPPVSGGAARAWLTDGPLSADEILREIADPLAGGQALFVGVVRQNATGAQVRYLEYEAYAALAVREMDRIAAEAIERFGALRVAIAHRTGRVDLGEASVIIGVAAAHRAQAFDACRHCINALKRAVPIWKKEVWDAGEAWVGATAAEPADRGGNAEPSG